MEQKKINAVIEFVCNLNGKPEWVKKEQIKLEWFNKDLNIIFNEIFTVHFDFHNIVENYTTTFSIEGESGINPYDMQYMLDIMENKKEFFNIITK